MAAVAAAPRTLPGLRSRCRGCRQPVVFGRTPAGKLMPLDPVEAFDGNVAASVNDRGGLDARTLKKGETHDPPDEYRAMPHFATCTHLPPPARRRRR